MGAVPAPKISPAPVARETSGTTLASAEIPSAEKPSGLPEQKNRSGEENYGEEQWERTLSVGDSMPQGEDGFPATAPTDAPGSENTGPLPELDDLLKQIPPDTRELVDALFRGRFVGVQVIDRSKLI